MRERKASQTAASSGDKSKESKNQKGEAAQGAINEKDEETAENMDFDEDDEATETQLSYRSHVPVAKESPLERRALMSLEKQLELELPESKLDLKVNHYI